LVVVLFISVGLGLRKLRFPGGPLALRISRVFFWLIVACHTLAFVYVLRRYVVGISEIANWQTLFSSPHWQPPLGWLPLTVLYLLVTAVGALLLFRYLHPESPLVKGTLSRKGGAQHNSSRAADTTQEVVGREPAPSGAPAAAEAQMSAGERLRQGK